VERGEIWHVDLDPVVGREEQGPRYVMILSPAKFNRVGRAPLCAPITRGGEFARRMGFTVSLVGAGINTDGVVLCHQIRTLDLAERKGRFVETAPSLIIDEVLRQVSTLLE
jgi:mRNA interferase ChpB